MILRSKGLFLVKKLVAILKKVRNIFFNTLYKKFDKIFKQI